MGRVTGKPTTFAPSAHGHVWGDISGTPATLAGYGITNGVTTTRKINSGVGLKNGGDLSADRTLALDINGLTQELAPDFSDDLAVIHSKAAGVPRKVPLGSFPVDWSKVQNKPSSLSGLGSSTKNGADFRASGAGTSGNPYVITLSSGNSLTHVDITDGSAGEFYELWLDATPSNGQWWAVYLDQINGGTFRVKVGSAAATVWNVNGAWRLWMIMDGDYQLISEGGWS